MKTTSSLTLWVGVLDRPGFDSTVQSKYDRARVLLQVFSKIVELNVMTQREIESESSLTFSWADGRSSTKLPDRWP